jgi:hypothetical protein
MIHPAADRGQRRQTTGVRADQRGLVSGQLSAAPTAVREPSILTGHRVEGAEIASPGEFDHLSDDELERVLAEHHRPAA